MLDQKIGYKPPGPGCTRTMEIKKRFAGWTQENHGLGTKRVQSFHQPKEMRRGGSWIAGTEVCISATVIDAAQSLCRRINKAKQSQSGSDQVRLHDSCTPCEKHRLGGTWLLAVHICAPRAICRFDLHRFNGFHEIKLSFRQEEGKAPGRRITHLPQNAPCQ